MGIIMLIVVGIILFGCVVAFSDPEKSLKETQRMCVNIGNEIWVGEEVLDMCHGSYVGGVKNVSANLEANKIMYFLRSGIGIGSQNGAKKLIKYGDIQDVYIDNTRSIEQKVSMGKLLCFGLLALGMEKNTQQTIREVIVVNVKDEDGEYNVFIEAYNPESVQELYNSIIRNKQRNLLGIGVM